MSPKSTSEASWEPPGPLLAPSLGPLGRRAQFFIDFVAQNGSPKLPKITKKSQKTQKAIASVLSSHREHFLYQKRIKI